MTLIFGRTWDEIQYLQQGGKFRKLVSDPPNLPTATQADIELLRDKGIDHIRNSG